MRQFQLELCELKQKTEEGVEDAKARELMKKKLQAALISRKNLKEELSSARDTVAHLTKSLADVESQVSDKNQECAALQINLALLHEERDKSLLENQSLRASCESLKLALEGLTEEQTNLMKELESVRCSNIAESAEWEDKHKELQKEYEVLLQSYENASNEVQRIQHVVAGVQQEMQELQGTLRRTETDKREVEKQLQDAEQEMEEIKERMKKCATSKDQKILELEEENDRLRAEAQPLGAKVRWMLFFRRIPA